MKKAIKKLMAALLAVAMLCAMAVPAMAEGETTYKITIDNPVGTYEAYQIFAGTLNEEGALGNIQWGSGVTAAGQTAFGIAADKAKTLSNESDAKAFAVAVSQYLASPSGNYSSGEITGLAAGYYLIRNKTVGDNETYTSFILSVVKDVHVSPKGDKPTMEKKVMDKNDTENTTTGWQDSADYDIGDDVPFQLTATIANNFADYTTYKLVFHDTQSDGLTFNNDVTVKVGSISLASNQFNVVTDTNDSCSFHVEIPNLKSINGVRASDTVTVNYTSKLNNSAKIGSTGNPNEAYLEYSNNPYSDTDTTTTTEDKVTVFTFKVVVNKTKENGKSLNGAAFALYKKYGETWTLVSLNNATETDGKYTISEAAKTTFSWEGLDDGDYKIVEVITPAGYNTIEDQYFTVIAQHDDESSNPKLTSLSGNPTTGDISFTAKVDEGSLTTNVINKSGATLPSTGGIGTTIFYVVGGGLMVAAAVLLITKKRMENK